MSMRCSIVYLFGRVSPPLALFPIIPRIIFIPSCIDTRSLAFCTSHLRWRCVRHLHGRCTRFRSRMRCDARRLPGPRTMVECKRPPTGLNEQEPASQTRTGNDDSGDHCDDQSIGADLFGYIGVHENNAEHPKRRMRNSSAQRGFPRDCNVAPMGRTSCPVCATAYTQRKEWLFTVISYRQTVCSAKSM